LLDFYLVYKDYANKNHVRLFGDHDF